MPVKLSTHFHWDEDGVDMANLDVNDIFNTTPFLSDDIWKKFELDLPIGDDFFDDIVCSSDAPASSSPYFCQKIRNYQKIRNHDCMWAGQCGSKDHPADEQRAFGRTLAIAPVVEKTPVAVKQTAAANNNNNSNSNNNNTGRSLLIKTVNKQPPIVAAPVVTSPDSPPMSDDEEIKAKTKTLQFLHDAISECDLDEDSDLCEYFEEEELLSEPVEETTTIQPRAQHARENDHSYHKDKNSSMRVAYLGIDTPSDSEEEIDVVSISEKQNSSSSSSNSNNNNTSTNNRMASTLPNNPTLLDRQQIQKTMATAITNKQVISSPHVKTISPPRKSSIEQTPKKRKLSDSRRMKRSRYQYRMGSSGGSPYKKRGGYNHSSDSEQEPSEKRSLHNNMERQRRVDLRNAFEDLKSLVPEVSKKERAAKVVILREAAVFCDQLGHTSESMKKQLEELRRQQHRLRARVSQLRKSLASKHR